MLDVEDPKMDRSNTTKRSDLARWRIPVFVERLSAAINAGEDLSERDVRLLYGEYRAYFRSRRPFRRSLSDVSVELTFEALDEIELLLKLHRPREIDRREAVQALYALWALVSMRDEALASA